MLFTRGLVALIIVGAVATPASAQSPPGAAVPSVEEEVAANILNQVVGRHTLEVFNLPPSFLGRVADRVIRAWYQENFHKVSPDTKRPESPIKPTTQKAARTSLGSDFIRVYRTITDPKVLEYRRSIPALVPPLRGYRAPIQADSSKLWPFDPPNETAPVNVRLAADLVAERLAFDGLLMTLAQAIEVIGSQRFRDDETGSIELLRSIGIPVDMLNYFSPPKSSKGDGRRVVGFIAAGLSAGKSAAALSPELRTFEFRFSQSRSDFQVATECGTNSIGLLRLQMPPRGVWGDHGSGGAVDLAEQLIKVLPDASFVITVRDTDLDLLAKRAADWPLRRPAQLTIVAEPLPLAQWAQDMGKAGTCRDFVSGEQRHATLVPRYGSQREDGSLFSPNESFLTDGLSEVGHVIVQSPLLFQGGNLMVVRDPATELDMLLMGEAEVYRNIALGLTREQVLQAFKVEFAVDRCIVLPAVSFHIDYDLCLRQHDGRLIVFMNDTLAAVAIILRLGIEALAKHGVLDATAAQSVSDHLIAGRIFDLVTQLRRVLAAREVRPGLYRRELADAFSTTEKECGVGNLQRFLLALDILNSTLPADQLDAERIRNSYLTSFKRRESDHRAMTRQLSALGWRIARVPGLAEVDRGINYVNGLHDRERYLMPAYGGFYSALDKAAIKAFESVLGPSVTVLPIHSAQSQRRAGAIHCSTAAHPSLQRGVPSNTK